MKVKNLVNVTGNGDTLKLLVRTVQGKSNPFDFAKIIPVPQASGKKQLNLNKASWGTKDNSVEAKVELCEDKKEVNISFETAAWPEPVFMQLVKMFPNLSFEGQWASNKIGYDCGFWSGENGEMLSSPYPDGMDEIVEKFGCAVWGIDSKLYFGSKN